MLRVRYVIGSSRLQKQCLPDATRRRSPMTNIIFKSAWEHLVLNPTLPCCEACEKIYRQQTLSLTCATLAGRQAYLNNSSWH